MEEKLKEFFRKELYYTQVGLHHEDDLKSRNEICWYARQRGLGAVEMAQMCGLSFKVAEKMFYEYCYKLEEMEHEML